MNERFDDFIRERRYLKGVSERTINWYQDCFAAWRLHSNGGDFKMFTINPRDKGTSPISINTYICGLNAYFKWAGIPTIIGYLKEEQNILATFSAEQIHRLIHWKRIRRHETRAHAIALVALDTGLRISELLSLTRQDVNLDNLVLLVHGKGNKQRLVPVSIQLRKVLYRHLAKHQYPRVFCTRTGTPYRCDIRNEILKPCAGRPASRAFARLGMRFVIRFRLIIPELAGTSTTSSGSWRTPPSPPRNGICGAWELRIYNGCTMDYHCCQMPSQPSTLNVLIPIVTGVSGFFGGILSEPLKQVSTQWLTKRNLRRFVYAELASNLDSLFAMIEGKLDHEFKVYKDVLDLNLSYKNFDFAESQPLIFHQLTEALTIRNIYSGSRKFLSAPSNSREILISIEMILNRCSDEIREGVLSSKLLQRFDNDTLNKHIKMILQEPHKAKHLTVQV